MRQRSRRALVALSSRLPPAPAAPPAETQSPETAFDNIAAIRRLIIAGQIDIAGVRGLGETGDVRHAWYVSEVLRLFPLPLYGATGVRKIRKKSVAARTEHLPRHLPRSVSVSLCGCVVVNWLLPKRRGRRPKGQRLLCCLGSESCHAHVIPDGADIGPCGASRWLRHRPKRRGPPSSGQRLLCWHSLPSTLSLRLILLRVAALIG